MATNAKMAAQRRRAELSASERNGGNVVPLTRTNVPDIGRVLDLVRYEARPHYVRLFRHARLARLTSRGLSRADYIATLDRLFAFFAPLDLWLAGALAPWAAELDLASRAKSPLIARDLVALGARNGQLGLPAPLLDPPSRRDPLYAMGWLYGVELALLAGPVVTRRLADTLGIGPATGAAFFHSDGVNSPVMWRKLTAFLGARLATPADRNAVISGVADMFEAACAALTAEATDPHLHPARD
jgi:heme oxygenase